MSLDSILRSTGKNLIPYPSNATSYPQTRNGLTCVSNIDGSYTVNGTCTADTWFAICSLYNKGFDNLGNVVLSGCPSGGTTSAYYLACYTGTTWAPDKGNGTTFNLSIPGAGARIEITIKKGYTCDNLTFYPQLELGTTATSYEPYQQGPKKITINDNKDVKKVTYGSRNLIPFYNRHGTATDNGITYTIDDSIITANGTVTGAQSQYFLFSNLNPTQGVLNVTPTETFYFSGCPEGGSTSTYYMEVQLYKDTTFVSGLPETGNGILVHLPNKDYNRIVFKIFITKDTTVNNLVFKPQLEFGTKATEYVRYNREIVWQKLTRNLLSAPSAATSAITGITFTNNSDGTVKVNGTATANSTYNLGITIPAEKQTWIFNETIDISGLPLDLLTDTVSFKSDNTSFTSIGGNTTDNYLYYTKNNNPDDYEIVYQNDTWTKEAYRTITFDIAPTGDFLTWLESNAELQANTISYKLSGCPSGGSKSTYYLYALNVNTGTIYYDTGDGITLTKDEELNLYIRVQNGTTVNNLIFEPCLERIY